MNITNENEKRKELLNFLIKLSEKEIMCDDPSLTDLYKNLEDFYYNPSGDNFRHFYSDIYSAISLIDSHNNLGSIDILAENINTIRANYDAKNKDGDDIIDVGKEINKLYDHVNLEVARINYTKEVSKDTLFELNKNKNMISVIERKIELSKKSSENSLEQAFKSIEDISNQTKKNQEDMQKEYITILGIFAAIVLAFTGGLTYSTSVLENIASASIYRVAGISLIIGFVFFNLIWLLLDFIRDINGKTIRRWYIFYFVNGVFIIGTLIICFLYKSNWL